MGPFQRIIARINTQLSDLTASQRLAIGLCVVVIVGSFLWLVRWSVEPDYVRLLEESLTVEQVAAARDALPAGRFRIVNNQIWVAPGDRHELFWLLQSEGALPADTSVTFQKLIEDDSPFRPESENHFRRRVALQSELAKVIASSPVIKTAEVFITDQSKRLVDARDVAPTASVKVQLMPGSSLDNEKVQACADLVAGSVPGLEPHRVSIIDGTTLRAFRVPDPEDAFAQGMLQEQQKNEIHLREKIQEQLSYIPGVRVAVSVLLDTSKKQVREFEYGKPAVSEEQSTVTESQSGTGGGETGVGPNVGQSLSSVRGRETSTREESQTSFQEQPLAKEVMTHTAPFALQRATASIGVPRSYLVGVFKATTGSDAEPTEEQLAQQFTETSRQIKQTVKTIIMAQDESAVTVEHFPDLVSPLQFTADGRFAVGEMASGGEAMMETLVGYAPQGGLALLALLGIFMLSRLAQRSAADASRFYSTLSGQSASEGEDEEPLTVGAGTVGRVDPSDAGMLIGREIDDETLRADQISEQVGKLVDDDPESVARLITRWADLNS